MFTAQAKGCQQKRSKWDGKAKGCHSNGMPKEMDAKDKTCYSINSRVKCFLLVIGISLLCRVCTSNWKVELTPEIIHSACLLKFRGTNSEVKCVHVLSLMKSGISNKIWSLKRPFVTVLWSVVVVWLLPCSNSKSSLCSFAYCGTSTIITIVITIIMIIIITIDHHDLHHHQEQRTHFFISITINCTSATQQH